MGGYAAPLHPPLAGVCHTPINEEIPGVSLPRRNHGLTLPAPPIPNPSYLLPSGTTLALALLIRRPPPVRDRPGTAAACSHDTSQRRPGSTGGPPIKPLYLHPYQHAPRTPAGALGSAYRPRFVPAPRTHIGSDMAPVRPCPKAVDSAPKFKCKNRGAKPGQQNKQRRDRGYGAVRRGGRVQTV